MTRAEQIKALLPPVTDRGYVVDKIHIIEGDRGYSYESVFGKYLNDEVSQISVEEPYIRDHYQVNANKHNNTEKLSKNKIVVVFTYVAYESIEIF